jgi:hypothetical protein
MTLPLAVLNQTMNKITSVNENAGRTIWRHLLPLPAANRIALGNNLELGFRLIKRQAETERRETIRAIMLCRLLIEDIDAQRLRTQLNPLGQVALTNILTDRLTWIRSHAAPGQVQQGFDGPHANCYAYAANCLNPTNETGHDCRPGLVDPVADSKQYASDLIIGALGDGCLAVAGNYSIDNPPPVSPGYYTIALLNSGAGFHFIRRDPITRQWSWKDHGGTVKKSVMATPRLAGGFMQKMWLFVTDDMLPDLMADRYMPWAYANMQFRRFFEVPIAGIQVSR